MAGREFYAAECHGNVAFATTLTLTAQRVGVKCAYANIHGLHRHAIAHATVNDYAAPIVLLRQQGQLVADQGAADAAAAIDNEHVAFAGCG